MEQHKTSRYLSRRSFLIQGSKVFAIFGLGSLFGTRTLAQDADMWPETMELSIDFEVIAPNTGRYKRPYIAVWIEDTSGFPIRTLALWLQSGKGKRWWPDLRRWYKNEQSRKSQYGGDLISLVSGPTRLPGKYNVVWDGINDAGYVVALGDYYVCVESAREHGPYLLIREKITLGAEGINATFAGSDELGNVNVNYRERS
jgi:hypothetical protein